MRYDATNHLSSSEYSKMCKVPKGCVKSEFLSRYTSITYSQLKREYDYCDPIAGQFIKIDDVTVLFV